MYSLKLVVINAISGLGACVCVCGGAFVNAGKQGHTLVNEQVNVDTPPNVDVLGFLLCPGDRK